MEILQNAVELAEKILNNNYDDNADYRLLAFCEKIYVDNKILLFNNLTKELILLSGDEVSYIENNLNGAPNEFCEKLVKGYFFVPIEHNDIKLSDELSATAHLFHQSTGINSYTILPTTGCNARCFYCYEAGLPIFSMNDDTANDVADYIIKKRNPNKKVKIRWFGGEPLCNKKAIDIICAKLKKENIDFISNMVSNSYLFDEKTVKNGVDNWNLKSVQVTLDGCKDTYNKVKNYINEDTNAFTRVTDNIQLLCEYGIKVTIRLNMDEHNAKELFELVDWLESRYNKYENLSVYARPLFEDIEVNSVQRNEKQRKELTEKFTELQEYISIKGFETAKSVGKSITINCCQADSKNSVLISPQGKLGKCEHHINDDFFGSIYDDKPMKIWTEYCTRDEKCNSCFAYPSCKRLKKCYMGRNECFDYEQYIRINSIRKGMLSKYEKYKADNS